MGGRDAVGCVLRSNRAPGKIKICSLYGHCSFANKWQTSEWCPCVILCLIALSRTITYSYVSRYSKLTRALDHQYRRQFIHWILGLEHVITCLMNITFATGLMEECVPPPVIT